jgi:hypothetical protein
MGVLRIMALMEAGGEITLTNRRPWGCNYPIVGHCEYRRDCSTHKLQHLE